MAELEARSGGACADSAASREPVITNLKLDFTMQLLIKGSLKGNPRQNISCQRRCPKTDSPPIQTCSSQKRFTFQVQVRGMRCQTALSRPRASHCPRCSSFDLYRKNNIGNYECLTCELQDIDETAARRLQ